MTANKYRILWSILDKGETQTLSISEDTGLRPAVVGRIIQIMRDAGWIVADENGHLEVTSAGREWFENYPTAPTTGDAGEGMVHEELEIGAPPPDEEPASLIEWCVARSVGITIIRVYYTHDAQAQIMQPGRVHIQTEILPNDKEPELKPHRLAYGRFLKAEVIDAAGSRTFESKVMSSSVFWMIVDPI